MIVYSQPVELALPQGAPRSPGVHQSGIIRSIALETGILKPEWEEDQSLIEPDNQQWWASLDSDAKARVSMGLAWESYYITSQLPDVAKHPGEYCVDGIYMTPDGLELRRLVYYKPKKKLHEIKLTYKSLKTVGQNDHEGKTFKLQPLMDQWMYMAQIKGYCKGLETTEAALHILFVCGDYTYPMRPIPYRYDITFDQAEIDINWELLTDWRDHRMGLRR